MVKKKNKKNQVSQSQSSPEEKGVIDNFATSLDNLLNEFDINKYKRIDKPILIPESQRLRERTHKGTNIIGNSKDQNVVVAGSSKEKEHLNLEQHMDHYTYIDASLKKVIIPRAKADDYRLFSDFLNRIRDYAREDLNKKINIRYKPQDLKYKLTKSENPTLDLDDLFQNRKVLLNGNLSKDKEINSKLYTTKNDQALISQMFGDFKQLFEYHSKKGGLLYNSSKKGDFNNLPQSKIKDFLGDCESRLGKIKFNTFIDNLLYIDNFIPDEINDQYSNWNNAKKSSKSKPGPKKDIEKTKDDFDKYVEKHKDNPEFQKAVYNFNIEKNNTQNNTQNNEVNIDNSINIDNSKVNSDIYRKPIKSVIDAGTGYDPNKNKSKPIEFPTTPVDYSKSDYVPRKNIKENIEYNDNHDNLIDINKKIPFIPNERNEEEKMNSNINLNNDINKELDLLQSENPEEIYNNENKSQVHKEIYNLINKDIKRKETISESIEEVDSQYDLNDPELKSILDEFEELDDAEEMRKNEEAINKIIQEQLDITLPNNDYDPEIKQLKKELAEWENKNYDINDNSTEKYDIEKEIKSDSKIQLNAKNTKTNIKQYTKPEIKDDKMKTKELPEVDEVFTQFDVEYQHEEKLQEKLAEEKRIKEDLETTMNIIKNENEMIDYINSKSNPKLDTNIKNYKMENGILIPSWYNSNSKENINQKIKTAEQEMNDVYKEDVKEDSTEKYKSVKNENKNENKNEKNAGEILLEEELNKYPKEVEYVESDEELDEELKEYLKQTGQINPIDNKIDNNKYDSSIDDELIIIEDDLDDKNETDISESLNKVNIENYNTDKVDKNNFSQIKEFNPEDVDKDQFTKINQYETEKTEDVEINKAEVSETDLPEYNANKLDKDSKEVNQAHQDIADLVNADIQKREASETNEALDNIKQNASLSWDQVYNNTVDVLNDIGVYSTPEKSINLEKITDLSGKPLKDILANYENIKLVDGLQESIIKEQYDSLKNKVELSFTYDQLEEDIARYGVESGFYQEFQKRKLENLSDSLGNETLKDIINSHNQDYNKDNLESETNDYQNSKYSDDPEIQELRRQIKELEKQEKETYQETSDQESSDDESINNQEEYKDNSVNDSNQEYETNNQQSDYQESFDQESFDQESFDQESEDPVDDQNNEHTEEPTIEDELNNDILDVEVEQPSEEIVDYITHDYGQLIRNTGHMIKKLASQGKVKYKSESDTLIDRLADAHVGNNPENNLKNYVKKQMDSLKKAFKEKTIDRHLKEHIINRREGDPNRFNYGEDITDKYNELNEYSRELQNKMADMDNNNFSLNYLTKINARNWFRSVNDHKLRAEKYQVKGKINDAIDQLRVAIRKADKKGENAEDLRLQKSRYLIEAYDTKPDQLKLSAAVGELYKVAETADNIKTYQAYGLLEQAYTKLKQTENVEIAKEVKNKLNYNNPDLAKYKQLKELVNNHDAGLIEKDDLIRDGQALYGSLNNRIDDFNSIKEKSEEELSLTNRIEVYAAKNLDNIMNIDSINDVLAKYIAKTN